MSHWTVSLSLLAFLAACNSGGIGIDDAGDTGTDGPVTTCDGHPFTLQVTAAHLASDSDGFDIDAHDTTSTSDPIGCGQVDASGGIDNALAALAPSVASFGFDLDTALSDAVANGDVMLDFTISGYDGGPDDDCVLIDVAANDQTVTTSVQASISGNLLTASMPEIPLSGQVNAGGGPQQVDITLRNVTLELPLSGAPDNATVAGGMLGAGIPWDEEGDNDLRGLVLASLPSYVPASVADNLIGQKLDLQPTGSQGSCDALSSALVLDASGM